MSCQHARDRFVDYLTGEIEAMEKQALAGHLAICDACRRELEDLNETWIRLGVLAEENPGPGLRQRFYAMLGSHAFEARRKRTRSQNVPWLRQLGLKLRFGVPQLRLASLLLIIAGFIAGYLIRPGATPELARLRQDVNDMRSVLTVSLLDQPSAGDRLKGVYYSMQLDRADETTVSKLLDIVDSDTSFNVRLAAIDALYLFSDHPRVRERLMQSLRQQSSPMVQLALVDLLTSWKEKKAGRALQQLITEGKLHPVVAERAKAILGKSL